MHTTLTGNRQPVTGNHLLKNLIIENNSRISSKVSKHGPEAADLFSHSRLGLRCELGYISGPNRFNGDPGRFAGTKFNQYLFCMFNHAS